MNVIDLIRAHLANLLMQNLAQVGSTKPRSRPNPIPPGTAPTAAAHAYTGSSPQGTIVQQRQNLSRMMKGVGPDITGKPANQTLKNTPGKAPGPPTIYHP